MGGLSEVILKRIIRPFALNNAKLFKCSSNQLRYIRVSLLGRQSYFLPVSFELPETVSVERLINAVRTVMADDPSLDVHIVQTAEADFALMHAAGNGLAVRIVELQDNQFSSAADDAYAFVYAETNLIGAPLIRLHIAKFCDGRAALTLALHHVVADAISLQIFLRRLSAAYDGADAPRGSVPSFSEIVVSADLMPGSWADDLESFWQAALEGVSDEAASLPQFDLEAEGKSAGRRDERHITLTGDDLARFQSAAAVMGVTPFRLTAAAYLLLLARYTGAQGAAIVIQSSGRRGIDRASDVIGQFSTALPVFARPEPATPFSSYVEDISRRVSDAIAHERLPFDQIIALTGCHPVFGINWYPQVETLSLGNAIMRRIPLLEWQSDFHLNLHCVAQEEGLKLSLSFPDGAIEPGRVDALLAQLRDLMCGENFSSDQRLDRIALMGPPPLAPLAAPPGAGSGRGVSACRSSAQRCPRTRRE